MRKFAEEALLKVTQYKIYKRKVIGLYFFHSYPVNTCHLFSSHRFWARIFRLCNNIVNYDRLLFEFHFAIRTKGKEMKKKKNPFRNQRQRAFINGSFVVKTKSTCTRNSNTLLYTDKTFGIGGSRRIRNSHLLIQKLFSYTRAIFCLIGSQGIL